MEERKRRTFKDEGSGPPTTGDWTRFDITASLRALRSYNPAVIIRELRKLHLRWWHAGLVAMTTILKAAGLGAAILDKIPEMKPFFGVLDANLR